MAVPALCPAHLNRKTGAVTAAGFWVKERGEGAARGFLATTRHRIVAATWQRGSLLCDLFTASDLHHVMSGLVADMLAHLEYQPLFSDIFEKRH